MHRDSFFVPNGLLKSLRLAISVRYLVLFWYQVRRSLKVGAVFDYVKFKNSISMKKSTIVS